MLLINGFAQPVQVHSAPNEEVKQELDRKDQQISLLLKRLKRLRR